MSFPANAYAEADGFSEEITVTETYNYTSPDGSSVITGTATFTYQRVTLASFVKYPKLACAELYAVNLKKATFIAVRYAVGKMPGWLLIFGSQDSQLQAFTQVTTIPGRPPFNTYIDANCQVFATCVQVAPNVSIGTANALLSNNVDGVFLGMNNGVGYGDAVMNANYTASLVQPGVPADLVKKTAAIAPVYRVTIPNEVGQITNFTLLVNGVVSSSDIGVNDEAFPYILSGLFDSVSNAVNNGYKNNSFTGTVDSLSPWVCEVQLQNYGDTLAAGMISYNKLTKVQSTINLPNGTVTVENPFPMSGQSFTFGPDANGLTCRIQL